MGCKVTAGVDTLAHWPIDDNEATLGLAALSLSARQLNTPLKPAGIIAFMTHSLLVIKRIPNSQVFKRLHHNVQEKSVGACIVASYLHSARLLTQVVCQSSESLRRTIIEWTCGAFLAELKTLIRRLAVRTSPPQCSKLSYSQLCPLLRDGTYGTSWSMIFST